MFGGGGGSARGGDLNGYLDQGSTIKGDLHFEDTFRVEGRVEGRIVSAGILVVGDKGEVEGEIAVGRVLVKGRVGGRITVTERVELAAGCRVEADIEAPVLVIEEGAHFQGRSLMSRAEKNEQPQAAEVRPIQAAGDGRVAEPDAQTRAAQGRRKS